MAIQATAIVDAVSHIQNGAIATVDKTSEAKLRKTGNPLRDRKVEKHSRFQIQIGCDWQKIENTRARVEGREARKIGPLPWGEHVDGTPLISHRGQLYLRGFWVRSLASTYYVDGREATSEEVETIKQFSTSKPFDKTQPLTIKLAHLNSLRLGGQELT